MPRTPIIPDFLTGIWGRWHWGYRLKLVRDQKIKRDTPYNFGIVFSFKTLKRATKDFSTKLRQGSYSCCYKGTLNNGTVVAVRVFDAYYYRNDFDFLSLLRTMSRISHRNLVHLIGYCDEGDHSIIVYEFVGNYELAHFFNDDKEASHCELNWQTRASICLGVAQGIEYLHQGIRPRIIHCDIKPSNVLLDDNFNPKITDFEIAHSIDDGVSHYSGTVAGTFGYMDPEFLVTGRLSEKTDVYGFGLILLEVITGKRHFQLLSDNSSLVDWVWAHRENDQILEVVDPTLSEVPEEEVLRFINAALFCVQQSSNLRPTMFEVLLMLSGGYDFSKKVLANPMALPVSDYDLSDGPAYLTEDEELQEEELCR